jgi:hypothetical protein
MIALVVVVAIISGIVGDAFATIAIILVIALKAALGEFRKSRLIRAEVRKQ